MPHPNRRTWTLETLSREAVYGLYFDAGNYRWAVEELEVMPQEVMLKRYANQDTEAEALAWQLRVPDGWRLDPGPWGLRVV